MRTRIAPLVAACLLATACSGSGDDDGASGGGGVTVTITDFAFGDIPTATAGEPVTVENSDSASHTFTAAGDEFDTGSIAAGESATLTVDAPGDYDVLCTIHPSMTGTLTVEG